MSKAVSAVQTRQEAPQAQIGKATMEDATQLIKALETPYLRDLQKMLANEIESRKHIERNEAIFKVQRIAADMGCSVDDLLRLAARKHPIQAARVPKIKYAHPTTQQKWSGLGKVPQWVKDWETQHGSRDGLMIAKA